MTTATNRDNKISKQDYRSSITANITPKEAFEIITRVSEWWTANLEGSSKKPGDIFTTRFGETFTTFKIVEAVPYKKIVWLVTDCHLHWLKDKKEWKGTKISFEILPKNNSTQINFTHIGLVPEVECFDDCKKGWDHYIKESLFKLITEGKGLPDRKKS